MSSKIIWGDFSGKNLKVSVNSIARPLTGKVKMSVFNVLFNIADFDGLYIIDAFCGTGSFGIECMSLGAQEVVFIDNDTKSIRDNLKNIGNIRGGRIIRNKVLNAFNNLEDNKYHIIFLDPPFSMNITQEYYDEINRLLTDNGVLIIRFGPKNKILPKNNFEIFKEKKHAPSHVYFFIKKEKK